jgi:hypothetical protein
MMDWKNRMKFRSATAGAAMVIGAITNALGTAHADPAQTPAPAKDDLIDYSVRLVDKAVVATLKGGTFQLVDKPGVTPAGKPQQVIDVKNPAGQIAMEMPLEYRVSGVQIPVQPVVKENGKVLELTPQKPVSLDISKQTLYAHPVASTVQPAATGKQKIIAQPIASPAEDSAAMNDFSTKFGLAVGIGSFVGLAVGAVIGCAIGLLGIVVGCLVGLPTGATIGGILGTIAFGGPTLLAAGYDLVNTLQAKPGTTKWAQTAAAPVPGAPAPAPQR